MKFSIRDLLWLTVVVMLAAGWWLDHAVSYSQLQMVREHAPMLYETISGEEVDTNILRNATPNPSAPAPKSPKD